MTTRRDAREDALPLDERGQIPGQMDVYEVLEGEVDKYVDEIAKRTDTPRHLLRDVTGDGPHDRPMTVKEVVASRLKGRKQ